eukprot:scaffold2618_cov69-Skeletonema_dohrnii-CCMP3373.AAC.1
MLSQFTSLSETFDAHVKSTTGKKPVRSFLEFMLDSPDIPALARDDDQKEYEQWFDMKVGYDMTQLNKFLPEYCRTAEGDSLVFADNHDFRVQEYATRHYEHIQGYLVTANPPETLTSREEITIHHLCRYLGHRSHKKQRDELGEEAYHQRQVDGGVAAHKKLKEIHGEDYGQEMSRRSSAPRKKQPRSGSDEDGPPRKRIRTRCSHEGCTNRAEKGGVCCTHGAERPRCSRENCTNYAQQGGVCRRHGAEAPKCSHENCTNQARKGGVCMSHGAVYVYVRPRCSHEGCTKQAQKGGVCCTHGAKQRIANAAIPEDVEALDVVIPAIPEDVVALALDFVIPAIPEDVEALKMKS